MPEPKFIAITFARQFGSRGSELAQRVAGQLGWFYLDRKLLQAAAKELGVETADIADHDEHVTSLWRKILETFIIASPVVAYAPPPLPIIRDEQLIEVERRIMCKVASQNHCIVVGHGAFHFLKGHARLFNIFVHASMKFRCQSAIEIYNIKAPEEAIDRADRERERFIYKATGLRWLDALNYHLSVDMSHIGMETSQRWIVEHARRMLEKHETGKKPHASDYSAQTNSSTHK